MNRWIVTVLNLLGITGHEPPTYTSKLPVCDIFEKTTTPWTTHMHKNLNKYIYIYINKKIIIRIIFAIVIYLT